MQQWDAQINGVISVEILSEHRIIKDIRSYDAQHGLRRYRKMMLRRNGNVDRKRVRKGNSLRTPLGMTAQKIKERGRSGLHHA
jgi:hypothetical protein